MDVAAVSIQGLTKVFLLPFRGGQVVAVRNLSLEVQPGEVYGLLGPNGSGKSTTFKSLLGLVKPTAGRTQIFGQNSSLVASREEVGFLPENPYFYKYLTGEETIRFYGKICGLQGAQLNRRVEELLDLVGLQEARKRRLSGYSKGMLQRIGLAQALVQRPRLVVLDEPTAGVDPAGSTQIRRLILDLKKEGITVLLSSHLLAQAQEVCDRVGILSSGKLVREGHLDDLISVENQREIILENADEHLMEQIETLSRESGAKVVATRKPQTTLEKMFLDVTEKLEESGS